MAMRYLKKSGFCTEGLAVGGEIDPPNGSRTLRLCDQPSFPHSPHVRWRSRLSPGARPPARRMKAAPVCAEGGLTLCLVRPLPGVAGSHTGRLGPTGLLPRLPREHGQSLAARERIR